MMGVDTKHLLRLFTKEPQHWNDIKAAAWCFPYTVESILMELELCGYIKQHPGKMFTITKDGEQMLELADTK